MRDAGVTVVFNKNSKPPNRSCGPGLQIIICCEEESVIFEILARPAQEPHNEERRVKHQRGKRWLMRIFAV